MFYVLEMFSLIGAYDWLKLCLRYTRNKSLLEHAWVMLRRVNSSWRRGGMLHLQRVE